MNESNKYYELDELLIKAEFGLLDEQEKKRLEELIRNSPDYEKVSAFHKDLNIAFAHTEDRELKDKLDAIFDQVIKRRHFRIYSGIAATLILLIGLASFYLWLPNKHIDGKALFTEYYQKPSLAVNRAPVSQKDSIYEQAVALYNKKDFQLAEKAFTKLVTSDSTNTFYLLYSGICDIELLQESKALAFFEKIIQLNDPVTKETAIWYTSLCYLRINKISEAKRLLEEISSLNGDYSAKAESILKRI